MSTPLTPTASTEKVLGRLSANATSRTTRTRRAELLHVVLTNPCWLLSRELLYTALTRHKDRLVILYEGPLVEYRRYAGNVPTAPRTVTALDGTLVHPHHSIDNSLERLLATTLQMFE